MGFKKSSSSVGIFKAATLVVGLAVLIIGCFSHFESTWAKEQCNDFECMTVHKACKVLQIETCPNISLERYFVAMIIICFFVSMFGFGLTFLLDTTTSKAFKIIDMGYHTLSALLLLIAGIVHIISAEQINELVVGNKGSGYNFRRPEKLAAGVLTIFLAILYGITALLIAKENQSYIV